MRESALREAENLMMERLSDDAGEGKLHVSRRLFEVAVELCRRANDAGRRAEAASRPGPKRKADLKEPATGKRIGIYNVIEALLPGYKWLRRPGRRREVSLTDWQMALAVDRAMSTGGYKYQRDALKSVICDQRTKEGKNTANLATIAKLVRQGQKRLIAYRKLKVRDSGS